MTARPWTRIEGDALDQEIKRAGAVAEVSREVIASAKVEVDYVKATGALEAGSQFLNGSKALGHEG